MNNALVSVCIPVYNGEKTICSTIKSVLKQSYNNIEIIVLDNCSTDNTKNVVKTFSDKRIKLFENDHNVGMIGNWNRCFDYCSGEFMMILCADDMIRSDCVERKVKALNKCSDAVLAFSASTVIDENDKRIYSRHPFRHSLVADGRKIAYYSLKKYNIFSEPSNVLFRRKVAEKSCRFDNSLKYAVDWAYWIELLSFGKAIYIDDELTMYRVSTKNETSRLGIISIIKDDFIFINKIPKALKVTKRVILLHEISVLIRAIVRFCFMKFLAIWRSK